MKHTLYVVIKPTTALLELFAPLFASDSNMYDHQNRVQMISCDYGGAERLRLDEIVAAIQLLYLYRFRYDIQHWDYPHGFLANFDLSPITFNRFWTTELLRGVDYTIEDMLPDPADDPTAFDELSALSNEYLNKRLKGIS